MQGTPYQVAKIFHDCWSQPAIIILFTGSGFQKGVDIITGQHDFNPSCFVYREGALALQGCTDQYVLDSVWSRTFWMLGELQGFPRLNKAQQKDCRKEYSTETGLLAHQVPVTHQAPLFPVPLSQWGILCALLHWPINLPICTSLRCGGNWSNWEDPSSPYPPTYIPTSGFTFQAASLLILHFLSLFISCLCPSIC